MVCRVFVAPVRVLVKLHSKQAQGRDLAEKMLFLVHLLDWFPKAGYSPAASILVSS